MNDEPETITIRDVWREVRKLREDLNGRVDSLEQWRAYVSGITKATLKIMGGAAVVAGVLWRIIF